MTKVQVSKHIAEGCPSIQLNSHYLEIVETFFCLVDIIGVRDGASDSNVTIRGEWCKFRDQMPLLDSRVLPFGAKGKLYSARMYVSLYYMEMRLGQFKRKM